MDEPDTVGTQELARLASITYRQAHHWTRLGLLRPDQTVSGSGLRRTYSLSEVRVAWEVGVYVRAGIAPTAAAAAARGGGWLDGGVRVTLLPETLRHRPGGPGHQIPAGPAQAAPV